MRARNAAFIGIFSAFDDISDTSLDHRSNLPMRRLLALLAIVAGVVIVVALRRLLPAGTLLFRRGLPAVIATRGARPSTWLHPHAPSLRNVRCARRARRVCSKARRAGRRIAAGTEGAAPTRMGAPRNPTLLIDRSPS